MSLVSSSVSATASVANFTIKTSHTKNETSDGAINVGNLTEEGVVVSVSDAGTTANTAVSTSFSASAGDITSLSTSFGSVIDQTSTRYQLYDSSNNLIADNWGTTDQQTAYTQWVAGTLSLSASDTYTAIATPQNGVAATIATQQNQGTSIEVSSKLTGSDTAEYYNFSLTSGNDIKMDFDAGTQGNNVRVQLLDNRGNVIADNWGNAYQRTKYNELTSTTGLSADAGNYKVKVTYADGVDTTKDIPYSFQLYSGSTYSVVYNNNVTAVAYDPTAYGSVTATSDAQGYSATQYHTVNEKAGTAVNVGWLQQDVSALQVTSQLTQFNSSQYYTFTLQSGSNLKFDFDSSVTTKESNYRVQLYDSTGSRLIADSEGNADLKAAYAKLTSSSGISVKDGMSYVIKITYASDVSSKQSSNYRFFVMSGTSYNALYKTTASAQTYWNAVLRGNYGSSYSTASGLAAYLTAESSGSGADLFSALKMKV